MGPSLQLLWEFRFPYELRLTYLKGYVKRSRHGTDGQDRYVMGPPSRKDGPIIIVIVNCGVSDLFAIDTSTGAITTTRLLTGFSRNTSYLVNVTAEASGRIASTIVAIRIYNRSADNNKPFIIRPGRDGMQFSVDDVRSATIVTCITQ